MVQGATQLRALVLETGRVDNQAPHIVTLGPWDLLLYAAPLKRFQGVRIELVKLCVLHSEILVGYCGTDSRRSL
jgi:hypothetical protein